MRETDFKQTTIRSIPEGWQEKSLVDVAPLQRGFDLPQSKLRKGSYPVIYSNGIGTFHADYKCCAPGLITGRSGTLGKFTLIKEGYYWPHNTTLWVTNFNSNNPVFLYYLYSTLSFELSGTGTGVPTLNRNYLKEIRLRIPPKEEQQRIAQVLENTDDLIFNLKKLIEKKRAIKAGAMSQLLSGKLRLPGFSEPWHTISLSQLSEFTNITMPCDIFDDCSYVCTENMKSNCGGINAYEDIVPYVYSKSYVPFDILLSNIRPYLKKIWLADKSGCCSNDILAIRPNFELVSPHFLYYCLAQDCFFNYVMEGAAGTKMPRGNKTHISQYEFEIPSELEEQKAIAKVLTDMDDEISALEAKLKKYEQLKKGMMQQLLTGKIRLVSPNESLS